MLQIEKCGKIYYCPLKDNRQVDDSGGTKPYQRVDSLTWSEAEQQHGKIIKIKGFPAEHKVKVFRVVLSTQRTDYVVTNEMAQDNVEVVQDVCGFRWKVEQFHRETKQLTGIENISVAKPELSEIISVVPSWFGFVSSKSLLKRTEQFIASSMICWMIICANNSNHLRSNASCVSPNLVRFDDSFAADRHRGSQPRRRLRFGQPCVKRTGSAVHG